MKKMIRASYYDDADSEEVTETLTRTITIEIEDEEVEVDEDDIVFSNYDWAAADGNGEYESTWQSDEDDPVIELDDTSGVRDKVIDLLLNDVFEHVNTYRTFKINKCVARLVYIVPDVTYEKGRYGSVGNDVYYDTSDIFYSEADSKIECDWSRI